MGSLSAFVEETKRVSLVSASGWYMRNVDVAIKGRGPVALGGGALLVVPLTGLLLGGDPAALLETGGMSSLTRSRMARRRSGSAGSGAGWKRETCRRATHLAQRHYRDALLHVTAVGDGFIGA